jgi:hypothetical protein
MTHNRFRTAGRDKIGDRCGWTSLVSQWEGAARAPGRGELSLRSVWQISFWAANRKPVHGSRESRTHQRPPWSWQRAILAGGFDPRSQRMSTIPSNFAGDCRYCNRDKRVIFDKTGWAGTISNDWPQNHDYPPFGRNSCTALRRRS